MSSIRSRSLLALAAFCMAPLVHAEAMQFSTGNVTIDFDPEGFAFSRDVGGWGGGYTEEISPLSMSYTQVAGGVKLDFNGFMSLYATSYATFNSESLSGYFNAYFGFTPDAGYQITGYTITYQGSYSIETPGSVSVGGPGVSFGQNTGGDSFTLVANVGGPGAPTLTGGIGATGDVQWIQVFDGYETVLDRYETVLDYCEPEDPSICYYIDVPVYIEVPVYHDEMDLGEASVNLQSITVTAQVAAVPEPGVIGLLAGALPVLGGVWMRRRRHA